jgi:hypothetical protein
VVFRAFHRRRGLAALVALLLVGCDHSVDPGTDPDYDGDGISNLQEFSEGTDPSDPTSASAWHPEWAERPRLLVDADGLAVLLDALERTGEPWEPLHARLEWRCASEVWELDEDLTSAIVNTNIAIACAVLYAAGDDFAGDKAATILEDLPEEVDFKISLVDKIDLHAGQAILQGVRTWDLLLGVGYPAGHDPAVAEARLQALGEAVWNIYVEDFPLFLLVAQNNHNTKLAAAFAMLGMGANLDPRAARYVSYGLSEATRVNDLVAAADGGYAEGPSYQVYAMQSVLPFAAALDRWLGEESLTVRTSCAHNWDPDACVEENVSLPSLLADRRYCDGFDRFVEMLMPIGYAPNTDDGNLASGHLGYTAGLCASPLQAFGWGWQASSWASTGSVDLTADSLRYWVDAPAAAAPPMGPISRPDAGFAVLRDRWEPDGPWAMLLAESGVARTGGGGHEHPDALAFLWAARGEYLLLDCGYGSWEIHEAVNAPEDHNVILVDGLGASLTDAELLGVTAGDDPSATARIAHHGVTWTRTLSLVGDDVLVVRDLSEPTDGAAHTLTMHLHGATDTLARTEGVGRWTVGDQTLQVAVIANVAPSYGERPAVHAFGRSFEPHGVLTAEVHADQPVTWLTVAVAGDGTVPLEVGGNTIHWGAQEFDLFPAVR